MCKSSNVSTSVPIYLNIDILRFVAPCRANRDESGCPKTIKINGAERLRFSSQSVKASIRDAFGFVSNVDIDELKELVKNYDGKEENRSYYLTESIVCDVCGLTKSDKKDKPTAKKSSKKKSDETPSVDEMLFSDDSENEDTGSDKSEKEVSLYISLANLHQLMNGKTTLTKVSKEDVSEITKDINLFGRMYAANKAFRVEACAQIAHAVSVGKVDLVGDNWICRSSVDGTCSRNMGVSEIGSALMYFNANLNVSELLEHRGYSKEDVVDIVNRFVMSNYALEMKSGASGTAHNDLPCYCRITLKNSLPKNHLRAFYTPIDGDTTIEEVIEALDRCIDEEVKQSDCIYKFFNNNKENKGKSFRFKANDDSLVELDSTLNELI